jgi:transcriptional regulator with XRE-family HTH domain
VDARLHASFARQRGLVRKRQLTGLPDVRLSHRKEEAPVRTVANRIRDERVMWGMSQADLAEITGIARDKIAKIETGARGVQADEIQLFASAFQLDPSDLLGRAEARVKYRVNQDLPGTREAIEWFERCIDNSLFVRSLEKLYGGK